VKHRIIKGARGKSIVMADMFRADGGDLLVNFDMFMPTWGVILPLGTSIYTVDLNDTDLNSVLKQLIPMLVTHDSFDLYVYGLRLEDQVSWVLDWVKDYPTVRLTITQQTDGEIQVVEV
jgi:hypothetical protein